MPGGDIPIWQRHDDNQFSSAQDMRNAILKTKYDVMNRYGDVEMTKYDKCNIHLVYICNSTYNIYDNLERHRKVAWPLRKTVKHLSHRRGVIIE